MSVKRQVVTECKEAGLEAFKKEDYKGALEHFSRGLETDPSNETLLANRSAVFVKLGEPDKALLDAVQAIGLKPEWWKGYARKAEALCSQKEYANALWAYREGLDKDPGNKSLLKGMRNCEASMSEALKSAEKESESVYTDAQGVVHDWDPSEGKWVPRAIQPSEMDAWMSQYNASAAPKPEDPKEAAGDKKTGKGKKRKRDDEPAKPKVNPHIYVSGLPTDATEEEVTTYFSKCGLLKQDEQTGDYKVKLYRTPEGMCKGDGLITYYRVESVDLAIKLLDDSDFRPGVRVRVQQASFEVKEGEEKKKKGGKKAKKKRKIFDQTKDLAWDAAAEKGRHRPRTIVLKNMFEPKQLILQRGSYEELKMDLDSEASSFGEVERLIIFDTNPDGVVSIRFKEHEAAMACQKAMNGRFFAGKRISAEFWDGKTQFKVIEAEDLAELRLEMWAQDLERGAEEGAREIGGTEMLPDRVDADSDEDAAGRDEGDEDDDE